MGGIGGGQRKGADQQFSGFETVTSGSRGHPVILDAEEVRGSIPLAPTTESPGHGPFSLLWRCPISCSLCGKLTES